VERTGLDEGYESARSRRRSRRRKGAEAVKDRRSRCTSLTCALGVSTIRRSFEDRERPSQSPEGTVVLTVRKTTFLGRSTCGGCTGAGEREGAC